MGTTMALLAKLSQWAFTLDLASLTRELKQGMGVNGLLLAATSAARSRSSFAAGGDL